MKKSQKRLVRALINGERPTYGLKTIPKSKTKVSVIQALMSGGKTHWAINLAIPNLLKEGYKLITFFAPQNDLANAEQIGLDVRCACRKLGIDTPHVISEYDWVDIESCIWRGESVVVVTTNSVAFKEMRENEKKFGKYKWAWFGDEAHWGSTDNEENYKNNVGSTPPPPGSPNGFKARYYDFVQTSLKYTDRAVELTATPTRQMKGEIDGNYSQIFTLHDENASSQIKQNNTAWLDRINYIDTKSMIDDWDNEHIITNFLNKIVSSIHEKNSIAEKFVQKIQNPDFQPKLSAMIICKPKKGFISPLSLPKIKLCLKKLGSLPFNYIQTDSTGGTKVFDGITHKEIKSYSASKNKSIWIKLMNDPTNNIKLVLCVGKGVMGVNIPGLVTLVDFNEGDQQSKDTKEPITNNPVQRFGRMVRHYNGYDYSYDKARIESDLSKLSDWDLKDFAKCMNTFQIYCCNNKKYSEATRLFEHEYVYTFDKVNKLLTNK